MRNVQLEKEWVILIPFLIGFIERLAISYLLFHEYEMAPGVDINGQLNKANLRMIVW